MRDRHITLYIPGLFAPDAWLGSDVSQGLSLAALELLLCRGRRRQRMPQPDDGLLFELFGHTAPESGLPVAAVMRRFDLEQQSDDFCFCATPVNMQPDRDRLVMVGGDNLAVTQAEARQLANEFNQLFAEDGLRLDVPVSNRWYLHVSRPPEIKTQPLKSAIGQDVSHFLPTGEEAMQWHAILNEVQMLFHVSQVNEKRRQSGRPEINSFWLWGEGELPERQQNRWQQVWSNEPLSCALASLGQNELASMPASAEEWLEQADHDGNHLLVFDALADAVAQHDIGRWRDMLETVNQEWMEPLVAALQNKSVSTICLISDNAEFEVSRKSLKHWWKRPRTLAQLR